MLSLGDNIYLSEGDTVGGSGGEDDDWYFSYYEPYRFTRGDGPECFPGTEVALVDGRHLTWYGPSLVAAPAALSAQLRATVVHRGQVVGTWKWTGRGAKRTVEAEPFTTFPKAVTTAVPGVAAALP